MFAYSQREKTHAHRRLEDNVPEEVKLRRLQEVIATYRDGAMEAAKQEVGKIYLVLVEGPSKKDEKVWQGRTNGLRRCMFGPHVGQKTITDATELESIMSQYQAGSAMNMSQPATHAVHVGDYVLVKVLQASPSTLYTIPLAITTLSTYAKVKGVASNTDSK